MPAESEGLTGRIARLNRSNGGVPKTHVEVARVSALGMEGDRQDDLVHHGGPDRALSLWSLELIDALIAEGHPIAPGYAGENVTIAGLDWRRVQPGARLSLGRVAIEVTGFAHPCRTIMSCFADRRFSRISEKTHQGWSRVYARVVEPGELRVGDEVRLSPLLAE